MATRADARKFTKGEREAAVARANEIGPTAASRELGILAGTLSGWQAKAKRLAKAEAEDPRRATPSPVVPSAATPPALAAPASTPLTGALTAVAERKKRTARVYTPSERARALETVGKHGVKPASRMLGISRFTLYEWQRKVGLAAAGKITDALVTGSDADLAALRDRKILDEWKRYPGLGPSQLRNQLRRGGTKVSVHTVRRVMEENGYLPPKVKREGTHDHDYEAVRPNQLWHLDFFQRYIHKRYVSVLLIVDDYSRFIVGAGIWEAERSEAVLHTFESAVGRHGRPESVMSDEGAAFWAWRGVAQFTRLIEELGVDQLLADVPQKNGKSEILNANAQKELFTRRSSSTWPRPSAGWRRGWRSTTSAARTTRSAGSWCPRTATSGASTRCSPR